MRNQCQFYGLVSSMILCGYASAGAGCGAFSYQNGDLFECQELDQSGDIFQVQVPLEQEQGRIVKALNRVLENANRDFQREKKSKKSRRLGDAKIVMHPVYLELMGEPKLEEGGIAMKLKAAQPYRIKVDFKEPRHGTLWHELSLNGQFQVDDWQPRLVKVNARMNQSFGASNVADRKRLNGFDTGITTGIALGVFGACELASTVFGFGVAQKAMANSATRLKTTGMRVSDPARYTVAEIDAINGVFASPAAMHGIMGAGFMMAGSPVCGAMAATYYGAAVGIRAQGKGRLERSYGDSLSAPVFLEPEDNPFAELAYDYDFIKEYKLSGFVSGQKMNYVFTRRKD